MQDRSFSLQEFLSRPLVLLLLSYLVGLLAGFYLSIPPVVPKVITLGGLACYLIWILLRKEGSLLFPMALLLCFGLFQTASICNPSLPENHLVFSLSGTPLNLEGNIYRQPEPRREGYRLYVDLEHRYLDGKAVPVTGKLRITVGDSSWRGLHYGDRVRFVCTPRRPRNYNNPGGFDYERSLAFQGIFATAFLRSSREIARMGGHPRLNPFLRKVEGLRREIREQIEEAFKPPLRGIVLALVLGIQGEIPENVREEFAVAGVAHILAISGLHLGIVAYLCFGFICRLMRLFPWLLLRFDVRKASAAMTLIPVILYTFIAGGRISAVRAAIMVAVFLVAVCLDRGRELFHALAVAALFILLVSPISLWAPSFQLSFAAVGGILWMSPHLFQRGKSNGKLSTAEPDWKMRWKGKFWGFTGATVAAILATAPLSAYYFHRVSWFGLFSNFLVIPLVGFGVVPLVLSGVVLSFVHPFLGNVFFSLASPLLEGTMEAISFLVNIIPVAAFRVSTPSITAIWCYFLFVFSAVVWRRGKGHKIIAVTSLALLFFLVGGKEVRQWVSSSLRVTMLDVRKADAIFVEFPKGKLMLVDGGGTYDGRFDIGRWIVAPFLWKKGATHINYVVLTHPHPDHMNGLKFIISEFAVDEIWVTPQTMLSAEFKPLLEIIQNRKVPIHLWYKGREREISGVIVSCVNPPGPDFSGTEIPRGENLNEESMVLRITFNETAVFLTGDIGVNTEMRLIVSDNELQSDILKVPHHGSRGSSAESFIQALSPRWAVFTVGEDTRWKLPHPEIVKRYQEQGIEILRTDIHGAVTFSSDGKKIVPSTFR